ncbi:PKD domain-containing protein, partial [Methanosalsum natronophilum]
NTGDVEKCYAGGTLSGRGNVSAIGGLIGIDYQGNISDSYYDRETTGRKDDELGIPKSTRAMKRQATFENWDFAVTWGIEEGKTYPYLRWQPLYADFQANPVKGTYPLSVQFTDSSIAGTIDTWTWNFGDGHTGTGQTTSHTYTQSGTYSVSLTIEGPGGRDTIRKKSLIHVSAPPYATEFLRSSLAGGLNRTRLSSFPARVLGSRRSSFGNPALSAQQEQSSSQTQTAQVQQTLAKQEDYDAAVLESDAPLLLTPGVKEELRITLKNTGKSTWKTDDAIYLAAVGEYDDLAPEEFWRMALYHDVQPGETHIFIIELHPEIVGHYITEWRLVKINHFFFGEIFELELEVVESMLAFSGWGIW